MHAALLFLRLAGVDPDARKWAAEVVANGGTVSADRLLAVSNLIKSLKAMGTWWKTDDYWLLVAENAIQALTSLKQRRLAVAVGAPTFTIDRGFAFNGTTQYLDTGFVPSTMASAMTLGEVRLMVYERTNANGNTTAIGVSVGGTSNLILRPRIATNFALSQMQASSATSTDAVTDSRGMTASSRTGNGTTVLFYKNGIALTPLAGVVVQGTSLQSLPMFIGANNNNGVAAAFRAATYGLASTGGPLTALEEAGGYSGWQSYMTDRGAQV